jgi:hypothetical protein
MDPNNCGSCGKLCNISGGGCKLNDAGAPQCQCPPGKGACNGSCIDVLKDPNNCGTCGHACHNGQQCLGGGCGGYTVTNPSPQPWVDACSLGGSVTVLPSTQFTETGLLSLPFTLQYWGTPTNQFWIATAGTVGLDGVPTFEFPGENGNCPNAIPDGFVTSAAVGAFGDFEVVTSVKGICYATQGAMPNRQFVVTWEDATEAFDGTSDMTFSVVLSETTNTVDLLYHSMIGTGGGYAQGLNAKIGIQSTGGLGGITQWCDVASATTGVSVRYTPIP